MISRYLLFELLIWRCANHHKATTRLLWNVFVDADFS